MISVFKLPSVIVATGFPKQKTTYTHILYRVSNLKTDHTLNSLSLKVNYQSLDIIQG